MTPGSIHRTDGLLPDHLQDWHLPSGWSWGGLGLWRNPHRHTQEVRDPLGRSLAMVSAPERDQWLFAEARALGYHSHATIPTTYHFWNRSRNVRRGPAYLRRWIEGISLGARLDQGERFSFAESVRLFREAGQGVAYLHDHGVSHGALHPDHLQLTPTGRLWLLGWEWATPGDVRPGNAAPLLGGALPPEWAGRWTPDFASDQWCLGHLFGRMLEGGDDQIPAGLADLIAQTTAAEPAERFPTVAALLRELDRRMSIRQTVMDPRPHNASPESRVRWVTGDDYEVQRQVGSGGRGTVWHVRDLHLGRDVALKVLHREVSQHREAVQQFRREAMLTARLHHPAIVPILDWDQRAGEVWYTMPLAEQGSLAARLAAGPQPAEDVLLGMEHVLEGLSAAHEQGVIHRDLKPENVLIGRWRRWLLADFGLACLTTDTTTGGGTIGYAAPEQLLNEPQSAAVDVYGAAALAVAAFTGKPPVRSGNVVPALAQQLQDQYDLSGVPQALHSVLRKALASDPAARYPSATELLAAWRQAILHPPVADHSWWGRRPSTRRRGRVGAP